MNFLWRLIFVRVTPLMTMEGRITHLQCLFLYFSPTKRLKLVRAPTWFLIGVGWGIPTSACQPGLSNTGVSQLAAAALAISLYTLLRSVCTILERFAVCFQYWFVCHLFSYASVHMREGGMCNNCLLHGNQCTVPGFEMWSLSFSLESALRSN